jgi:hypothetical protein
MFAPMPTKVLPTRKSCPTSSATRPMTGRMVAIPTSWLVPSYRSRPMTWSSVDTRKFMPSSMVSAIGVNRGRTANFTRRHDCRRPPSWLRAMRHPCRKPRKTSPRSMPTPSQVRPEPTACRRVAGQDCENHPTSGCSRGGRVEVVEHQPSGPRAGDPARTVSRGTSACTTAFAPTTSRHRTRRRRGARVCSDADVVAAERQEAPVAGSARAPSWVQSTPVHTPPSITALRECTTARPGPTRAPEWISAPIQTSPTERTAKARRRSREPARACATHGGGPPHGPGPPAALPSSQRQSPTPMP